MKSLVLVFALLALSYATPEQHEIDAVLGLLDSLRNSVTKEVDALDLTWSKTSQKKQSLLASLGNTIQEQRFECQNKENDVKDKEAEIQYTTDFLKWLQARTLANNNRIMILESTLCDRGNNYVRDIKNDKVALALIEFLKKEIGAANEGTLSLAQIKKWDANVKQFMKIYKSGRLLAMVQTFQENEQGEVVIPDDLLNGEASDEEETLLILDEPAVLIVEDEGELIAQEEPSAEAGVSEAGAVESTSSGSDTLGEAKGDLLNILSDLEDQIRRSLQVGQDNSVASALAFADFKMRIEKENDFFASQQNIQKENLLKLQNQATSRRQSANLCQARLIQMLQALLVAEDDDNGAKQNYEHLKKGKAEEVAVFEEVYRIYLNQVASESDEFKQKVDSNVGK